MAQKKKKEKISTVNIQIPFDIPQNRPTNQPYHKMNSVSFLDAKTVQLINV